MTIAQLQNFLDIFVKQQATTRTVVVCPDGETFHFGCESLGTPLMLYIKNLDMLQHYHKQALRGLESSYLRGHWDCNNIPKLLSLSQQPTSFRQPNYCKRYHLRPDHPSKLKNLPADAQRLNTLGLEFHAAWLDPSLSESIAMFRPGKKDPLYIAQQRRIQHILQLLQHKHALSLHETHAHWGAFTEKACLNHDLTVTTASRQHAEFCKNRLENVPFPVNFQIKTHHLCPKTYPNFDAVIGIRPPMQHKKAWQNYFTYISTHVKPHGLVVLQVIVDDHMPHAQLAKLMAKQNLYIWEHESINEDAAKTYRYWLNNFSANYAQLEKLGFSDQFLRQWKYYLAETAYYFATNALQARQYILEKRT